MNTLDQRISVVMITRNEEMAVAKVIKDIQKVAPQAEIVIVDSSEDNTAQIASACGAKVIRQYPPCGYGPAMEKALRSASREVIVTLDCDDTYPTPAIVHLAKFVLEQHYDLVDASRLRKKPTNMPWLNYLANVFFAKLATLLFFTNISDLHSGMRAYRQSMIAALSFEARGAALPVELLLKPLLLGYRVHSVYIDYQERIGQSKMQAWDSLWWTIKRLFKLRFLFLSAPKSQ